MRRVLLPIAGAGLLVAGMAWAQADGDRARLSAARAASDAAEARAQRLAAEAERAGDAQRRAAAEAAAVAARVEAAEAEIAAARARMTLIERQLDGQEARLATREAPVVRLVAALASLARAPATAAVAQPGSVRDLVHVRAVLATAVPRVRAETAALRGDLTRARTLRAAAVTAEGSLREGRATLAAERLRLARLEAVAGARARTLRQGALVESDRAIAMGERARDLVDQMGGAATRAATQASLAALPAPLPRPPRAGELAGGLPLGEAAYRLPVDGRVVGGLGELSGAGVRGRGLAIETAAGAAVVAPAPGRIVYAGAFRGYGEIVIIDHGEGWTTLLTGLSALAVGRDARVAAGDAIGRAAGGAEQPVGVELRRRGRPVDIPRLAG